MKAFKKFLCFILSAALIAGCLTVTAGAAQEDSSDPGSAVLSDWFTEVSPTEAEGFYQYSSTIISNMQNIDWFSFSEDCFYRPSYYGCYHLGLLSIQASLASISKYDLFDTNLKDNSNNSENITDMLSDMGFKDVEVNAYYNRESLENSAAVAVGRREFSVFGKSYTLLAIIPRGAGYKQEWAGNFDVDGGDIHEGYKEGRDEILRFVKQYIRKNNIQGNLKVWVTGHSRGGTLANLVGAFFAGGGIDYFGKDVSITPEDVYCYTYASSTSVKNGTPNNEFFSVEGARGGIYADDTPQEAYQYTGGGTVSVDSVKNYHGIFNFIIDADPVAKLPSKDWGFSRFGADYILNGENADLDSLTNQVYEKDMLRYFLSEEGEDLLSIASELVPSEQAQKNDTMNPSDYWDQRISAITYPAPTNEIFADEGYQDGMKAAFTLSSLLKTCVFDTKLNTDPAPDALILSYLAYAAERLTEEGLAMNDAQAIGILFEELMASLFGIELNLEDLTIDQMVIALLTCLAENEDTEAVELLISEVVKKIPEDQRRLISYAFGIFHPDYDPDKPEEECPPIEEILKACIRAGVYGAAEGTVAFEDEYLRDPAHVRQAYYGISIMLLQKDFPEIADIIGTNEQDEYDGSGTAENLLWVLVKSYLLTERDAEGKVVLTYSSLDEAADAAFCELIEDNMEALTRTAESIYGTDYADAVRYYFMLMDENIRQCRRMVSYLYYYTDGVPFSIGSSLETALTLIKNSWQIVALHCGELYLGVMKLQDDPSWGIDHSLEYVKEVPATCTTDGHIAYWILTNGTETSYFRDSELTEEISLEDTVIPATGHHYIITGTPATETRDGRITQMCEYCGKKLPPENVPRISSILLSTTSYTYNGKVKKPSVIVKDKYSHRIDPKYYTVTYSDENSKKAGSYTVTVTFKDYYEGTKTLTYKITQISNKIKVTPTEKSISYSTLKKKNQTFNLKANVKESAKTTFALSSVTSPAEKYIKVSSSGKVTVKKGLAKGTYTLKVKVTAAETTDYKKTTKTVSITITIK